VVGDHVVHLLGGGERLELVHRATSRDVFAHGALRAAAWLVGKPAGRYALRDVIT
jgi:4-hydroxy-tetrahydrodipicolinate reductase